MCLLSDTNGNVVGFCYGAVMWVYCALWLMTLLAVMSCF